MIFRDVFCTVSFVILVQYEISRERAKALLPGQMKLTTDH